ncbi:MAG TPA: extracellular solute-binding protein [Roseiflexaceae bacterium]|nr:extracellular solute-binding protein [Roseiflexaceae bacterium]
MHRYRFILLVLSAALALGGCDLGSSSERPAVDQQTPTAESLGGTEQPAQAADHVTITFGAIGFMRHIYEPLIAAFNGQHPGIIVQFVALDELYRRGAEYDELMRQIVSRADTAEAPADEQQFKLGLLRDLAPLIEADANFDRDDFYPGALASSTAPGGAIYKLPQSLELQLLFYNQDLWDARGVAAPAPDWTWQDVTAAARRLARKQGDTVGIYGLADSDTYLAVLLNELRGAGVDLLAANPGDVHVDRPEVVAVLERMADLFKSGAFYYPPAGQDWRDQVDGLIASQRLAMWGSGSSRGAFAKGQPPGFRLGVAAYPAFPGGNQDFANGWVMSSGTQHPNEAWAWLSFLSKQLIAGQEGGKGAIDQLNVLPARRSVAERSGYWSHLDDQTRAAVQAALDRPIQQSRARANPLEAYQPLIAAVQEIIGGTSAAAAAGRAQAAIAERAAQAQQTPAVTPTIQPVVVATPAPNVAEPGATTITFGMPLGKGSDRATQFVQQFNQANPAVFVQLKDTFTGSGMLSPAEAAAQTDCFASPLPPAPAELTATLDLQPLIDGDANFPRDDYSAALLAPYQQSGGLHGLPWGLIFRVLVYNKDLFDAAGLTPPDAAWSIDDFMHAAQKLTSGDGDTKQYGFVIPRSQSEAGKFLVHLFGAALVVGSGETLRPTYTDPKVVQAARQVVDLLEHTSPHARLNDYAQTSQQIDYGELTGQGRAGMWFAWGLYAYGRDQPGFTMAMAPPPLAHSVLDADDIATTSLYISAGTDKQQACWTWLRALSASTLGGVGGFPARRSVAQSDTLNQNTPGSAAVYQAYMQALDRAGQLAPGGDARGTPPIDYFWFYRAIDRGLQGRDLERELAEAQALTEQYIACARGGSQRDQCARQVDSTYGQY